MTTPAASEATTDLPTAEVAALQSSVRLLQDDNARLREQLDWFRRQVFGQKSEKRVPGDVDADQASLFNAASVPATQGADADTVTVPAHQRRKHRTGEEVNDTGVRYGPEVPVREIMLSCPELDGPQADQYEVIDHKVSIRLARQPGSHVVLKYLRPVVRRRVDGKLATVPAPVGVLDHAQLDVSLLAGALVDKFIYHLPLYRQHQRLADEGITLARSTLEQWVGRAIDLLGPIARAINARILRGAHLKIDETPIRAGRTKVTAGVRAGQGKMKQGWLWPVLGEDGDIAFGYSAERGSAAVKAFLGEAFSGTIQTDGYQVYAKYAAKLPGCVHALCWAHTRRAFVKAEAGEPQKVAEALELIRGLYRRSSTPTLASP